MMRRRNVTVFLLAGLLEAKEAPAQGPPAPGAPPKTAPPLQNEKPRVNLLLTEPRVIYRDSPTVPGDWSGVRREIESRFRPTRPMITEDAKPQVLGRQLTQAPLPAGGAPGQVYAPDDNVEVQEQTEALQRAYERPATSRTAEITASTDAQGRILSMQVSSSSGSAHFDEAALLAVREALADRQPDDERRAVVTRWRLRAAYAVTLPLAMAPAVARSSTGRVPTRGIPLLSPFWGTFDESSGTGQTKHAFSDKIETEIKLLSITPSPSD